MNHYVIIKSIGPYLYQVRVAVRNAMTRMYKYQHIYLGKAEAILGLAERGFAPYIGPMSENNAIDLRNALEACGSWAILVTSYTQIDLNNRNLIYRGDDEIHRKSKVEVTFIPQPADAEAASYEIIQVLGSGNIFDRDYRAARNAVMEGGRWQGIWDEACNGLDIVREMGMNFWVEVLETPPPPCVEKIFTPYRPHWVDTLWVGRSDPGKVEGYNIVRSQHSMIRDDLWTCNSPADAAVLWVHIKAIAKDVKAPAILLEQDIPAVLALAWMANDDVYSGGIQHVAVLLRNGQVWQI